MKPDVFWLWSETTTLMQLGFIQTPFKFSQNICSNVHRFIERSLPAECYSQLVIPSMHGGICVDRIEYDLFNPKGNPEQNILEELVIVQIYM